MGVETILLATAIAASAGSTVYQVDQANKQGKAASDEKDRQIVRQAQLEKEAKDNQAKAEADEAATVSRDQARLRQRTLAATSSGRTGTIKTGALGVQTPPATANKSLLGT